MKILFMGTPDFAAASLEKMYERGFEICAVFTQPDKPQGRGMRQSVSPVKELAISHGTPLFQPLRLKDESVMETIKRVDPTLIVVVAYGRILPDEILDFPRLGCINLHGSLLPKYRGSAPIQWSVLNGDETGGVTTMYINSALDSGDIIDMAETKIGLYESSGELFDRLKVIGAELLCDTIEKIENGTAQRRVQDDAAASLAPRLSREDSPIDWTKSAFQIVKHVCGLDPWPCATMELRSGALLKVYGVRLTDLRTDKAPGSVVSADENGVYIACGKGEVLLVTELQAVGKRRMAAAEYLRGHSAAFAE